MLKPSLFFTFGILFCFNGLSQSDTTKPAVCKKIIADNQFIHAITSGGLKVDPELGITSFQGHKSDSIYGFIETSDFRQVVFTQTPESQVIIYGLGDEFKVNGKYEEIKLSGLKESIAIHHPTKGILLIYRPS